MIKINKLTLLLNLSLLILVSCKTNNSVNKWENKACIQLGDSITWYDGHDQHGKGIIKGYKTYMEYLGLKEVNNQGVSAAAISLHKGEHASEPIDDICVTVDNFDYSKYDLVTIAGGVNDFYYLPTKIGEIVSKEFDKTTFIGAYQYIIEHILASNKNIQIVLFTPLPCIYMHDHNTFRYVLEAYVNATILVGKHYNLHVLDLFHDSGLSYENFDKFTCDGLHPNNEGFKYVCENTLLPFFKNI